MLLEREAGAATRAERQRESGWRRLRLPAREVLLVCTTVALTVAVLHLHRPHADEVATMARQLSELQAAVEATGTDSALQLPRRLQEEQQCYTEREATVLLMQGVGKLYEDQLSLTRRLEQLVVTVTMHRGGSTYGQRRLVEPSHYRVGSSQ